MARVAAVIVTYNSAEHLGPCLDSLAALGELEIVVVDNASEDDTRQVAAARPWVRLIANASNRGFGPAVNQGVLASEAPLILLLNPDTRELRGIDCLARHFEDGQTGAAGGMLTDAEGSPQMGFMYRRLPTPAALAFEAWGINRVWPGNPVNRNYRCLGDRPGIPRQVEQPAGAFLMFSREAWRKAGGFSERYLPIWFEDVDFCARLKKHGYFVQYDPLATAIHEGAHSVGRLNVEKRERYWYGSLLEYAAIHYGPFTYRIVCFAVASGAVLRGLRSVPSSGINALVVYGAVCRLAFGRMLRRRKAHGSSVVCP